jgi:glycosyltransferase involved in cell wall biosynthesis
MARPSVWQHSDLSKNPVATAKRVVIVAPVHPWDDVRVFQKEACTLAREGFEVILIAQAPESGVVNGVRLVPAPVSRSRTSRFFKLAAVLREALRLRGDIYHLHNPDTIPLALILKVLRRRVIYDTHEDFSKRLLIRDWIPRPIRLPLSCVVATAESFIGFMTDGCIGTQPAVCQRLGHRATLIANSPITQGTLIDAAYRAAQTIHRGTELRLVYVGGINRARGLDCMVDALADLNNAGIPARLWLIGPAERNDLDRAMTQPGWTFVDYLGRLPQAHAFGHMIRADIGLVTILDVADHSRTSPNKLYEYLVFGLPVIASDFADWRRTLPEGSGVHYVRPGSTVQIVNAAKKLSELPDHGRSAATRGRDYVRTGFSWEKEGDALLRLYSDMCA